jgi:uncharacterized damage-inducible protein DinB
MPAGSKETNAWGEVMLHVIAHEIHHAGQLSIWIREVGKNQFPPTSIGRGLITNQADSS